MKPTIRPRGPRAHTDIATTNESSLTKEMTESGAPDRESSESPILPPRLVEEGAKSHPELNWTELLLAPMEYVPVEALKPANRKTRRANKKAVSVVAASIKRLGFINPILADKNNVVIAGNTRLEAAKLNGLKTVPVIRLHHLTDEQLRLYAIADNKLAELSEWDNEVLALEFEELSRVDLGIDLEVTGFRSRLSRSLWKLFCPS